MLESNRELLIRGARDFGLELNHAQIKLIETYLAVLETWSARINLTAVKGEREQMVRLILDSMAPAVFLEKGMRVMDMGSGAGLPGVPLMISVPGLSVMLAESRRKRVDFLRTVLRETGLAGAEVYHGRVEDYAGGVFDAVLARALGGLDQIARFAAGILKPGGLVIAMKGPEPGDEIESAGAALKKAGLSVREVRHYELPEGAGRRSLVVLIRSG